MLSETARIEGKIIVLDDVPLSVEPGGGGGRGRRLKCVCGLGGGRVAKGSPDFDGEAQATS